MVKRVNFRGMGLKPRQKVMHKTRCMLDAFREYFKQVRCLRKVSNDGWGVRVKYVLYKFLRVKKLRVD